MPPLPPGPDRPAGPPEPGRDQAFRARAGAAVAALQRWYRPRTGLWQTAGWWNCANALTAVIQHSQLTGERRYRSVIETTFSGAQRVNPGFSTEFYDDDGWWALAWIAAFDLTGEAKYLDAARALFAGIAAGWDEVCGGGVWWTRGKTYKNAISNELFLLVAGRLHQRTAGRSGGYLDWALREWQWFAASGLIGPSSLVNDGLTADCANNGGTAWTYNQGVIIGGLVVLHEITGDPAYVAQAEAIAAAALRELTVPPGILAEPGERRDVPWRGPGRPWRGPGGPWRGPGGPWRGPGGPWRGPGRPCRGWPGRLRPGGDLAQFKGIFVRNLYQLYLRSPRAEYRDFILANATSLWRNSRNRRNQIGLAWTGPFDRADAVRQCSALDALNAAVGVTDGTPS